ncbi:unnamed protein product [Symbiodinium sp. CCMP2592]|nr:unnamed protein product [Symbiodinium sp. CCMP2592]
MKKCRLNANVLQDGSVVTWGIDQRFGKLETCACEPEDVPRATCFPKVRREQCNGAIPARECEGVNNQTAASPSVLLHIVEWETEEICSSTFAFAALRDDGSLAAKDGANERRVVTWGSASVGGDSSSVREQLTDVRQLLGFANGFAAIRMDGQPVVWGDVPSGRDGTKLQQELREVRRVYATDSACAVLRADGRVITWGALGQSLPPHRHLLRIRQICTTRSAFAAVRDDGSVIAWGRSDGGGDCSSVQHLLFEVKQLAATDSAFAALRADGHVIAWGDSKGGGNCIPVKHQLHGIRHVYATSAAFCALTVDGALVAWGDAARGGDPATELHNVEQIFAASSAFAALLRDGSVVAWGEAKNGGDCSLQLNDLIPLHLSGEASADAPFFSLASRESSRHVADRPIEEMLLPGYEKDQVFPTLARHARSVDVPPLCSLERDVLRHIVAGINPMQADLWTALSAHVAHGSLMKIPETTSRDRLGGYQCQSLLKQTMPQLPFATRLVETSATERLALFSSPLLSMQPGGNTLADKDAVQRLKATCEQD